METHADRGGGTQLRGEGMGIGLMYVLVLISVELDV